MKLGFCVVLLLGSCAVEPLPETEPRTLTQLLTPVGELKLSDEDCPFKQMVSINREWMHYEWSHHLEIRLPDWRGQSQNWAKIECRLGRPVSQFHP